MQVTRLEEVIQTGVLGVLQVIAKQLVLQWLYFSRHKF